MRLLGVVILLVAFYCVYLAMGLMLVKPAMQQFERGIQEYNDEIQRFNEGQ